MNGYRYREKAPLSEYFYNTGKTLGYIHHLSKQYQPNHKRYDYFDVFNVEYINKLIPSTYVELKDAIIKRWDMLSLLTKSTDNYGLVHFDFNDGNYHIDMDNGNITVFDFDNSLYCWYMYDLAQLWIGGTGWIAHEKDNNKRKDFMCEYFQKIMEGYRNETDISEDEMKQLPLFIDIVLIENIVDAFQWSQNNRLEVDKDEIEQIANLLINEIPYCGFI